MAQKPYIIAIDDMPYNLEVLAMSLQSIDVEVACVESSHHALQLINERVPDLILLDIMMPDMDGYTLCQHLKKRAETKDIPVIFISALDDVHNKVKAFELGGVDYITKPFNPLEVVARVKTHLKLYHMLEEMNTLLKESFHEIYTPLGIIKSSLALQEIEYGKSEHLQHIKAAVQSLHSIYEDIYYAIKKEVRDHPPEWIELERFLPQRIGLFTPQMEAKGLHCNLNFEIDSPMIKINATELERLIDNLLSNAIKYAKEGGEISIDILPFSDQEIQLTITNTSKKIQNVKQLFHELYREDHTVMGLGIGLSIVKKICDKYGITIDVEAQEDRICFILRYKETA
ncbi:MAG: hybrid sensor histidine kinase/response regulator [Hydrogenimonas sp.]|nr:MAG: hybrid sensor histidine kinase/response regulator [Hydrogenimonas sp.]